MKTIQTLLILLILSNVINAQNITADIVFASTYFKKADSLFQTNQFDSSIVYFEKAGKLYENSEIWQKYLRCNAMIARNNRKLKKFDKALQIAEQIKNKSIELLGENNSEEAFCYFIMGNIAAVGKNDYEKGIEYLQKARTIQEQHKKYSDLAVTYNNLGVFFEMQKNYEKAIQMNYKALSTYKKCGFD